GPLAKRLEDMGKQMNQFGLEGEEDDTQRVVMGFSDSSAAEPVMTMVVQARKPLDKQKQVQRMGGTEDTFEGKTYYKLGKMPGMWGYFPTSRVMVVSNEKDMKKIFQAKGNINPELSSMVRKVSGSTLWVAAAPPEKDRQKADFPGAPIKMSDVR